MSEAKKPTTGPRIIDVAHPGKSAPSLTSKPVLVTNRAILKDPMMTEQKPTDEVSVPETPSLTKPTAKAALHPTPQPTEEKSEAADDKAAERASADSAKADDAADEPKPAAKETDTEPDKAADDTGDEAQPSPAAQTAEQLEVEAEALAKHEAVVQKLVDSKKYFLPINAVEKRRSKRFIALGIVLSVLLALVWVDIALDAGLVEVSGVKPVTHFFSN